MFMGLFVALSVSQCVLLNRCVHMYGYEHVWVCGCVRGYVSIVVGVCVYLSVASLFLRGYILILLAPLSIRRGGGRWKNFLFKQQVMKLSVINSAKKAWNSADRQKSMSIFPHNAMIDV